MADGVDSLRLKAHMPALATTGICTAVTCSHDVLLPMFKFPEAVTFPPMSEHSKALAGEIG